MSDETKGTETEAETMQRLGAEFARAVDEFTEKMTRPTLGSLMRQVMTFGERSGVSPLVVSTSLVTALAEACAAQATIHTEAPVAHWRAVAQAAMAGAFAQAMNERGESVIPSRGGPKALTLVKDVPAEPRSAVGVDLAHPGAEPVVVERFEEKKLGHLPPAAAPCPVAGCGAEGEHTHQTFAAYSEKVERAIKDWLIEKVVPVERLEADMVPITQYGLASVADAVPVKQKRRLRANDMQERVEEFMVAFRQYAPVKPTFEAYPGALRANLILEEAQEFADAVEEPADPVAALDAICDLLYVTFGAASAMGVDIEPFFAEVHHSNMAKLGTDGQPIYRESDGKVMKPDGWKPPDLASLWKGQL